MKNVKSLTVVGGGTAGLISALILKQRSSLDVNLIYSSNIGIIGVGEGSTEHFNNFMEFVGIKPSEIIKECDATFKIGVMFDNWVTNKKYLHSVGEPFGTRFGPYYAIYAKQISENSDLLCSDNLEKNLVNVNSLNVNLNPPTNQYHFNTFKLNEFLKKIALNKGIKLFDDEIIDVKLEENGFIKTLVGKKTEYSSDFYIDATGFQKTLVNKLEVKWKSFNKYLTLNSAITFQTKDEDNYNFWTLAKAMKSGWRFKIPTWGRHGNGYIYDNNFITADKAKLELEEELGYEVEIGKTFNFDPGALETVWNKNCVAIGLSGSFFEPLEATSIGLSIQQSFLLMDKIQNYDDKVIESYNNSFNSIVENIRDFIVLHYLTKRNDTDFWKNVLNLEIPESLKNNLEKWKTKLPTGEDFLNVSGYSMFGPQNFIKVMHGLNLFDKEAILKEYNFLSNDYRFAADQMMNDHLHNQSLSNFMNHKDVIRVIREYN
jgi:tryptophan halogenase